MLLGRVSIWQHISYLMKRPNGHDGVPLAIPYETAEWHDGVPLAIPYDTPNGMMGCPLVSEYE